jgi:hypothetical protein
MLIIPSYGVIPINNPFLWSMYEISFFFKFNIECYGGLIIGITPIEGIIYWYYSIRRDYLLVLLDPSAETNHFNILRKSLTKHIT